MFVIFSILLSVRKTWITSLITVESLDIIRYLKILSSCMSLDIGT